MTVRNEDWLKHKDDSWLEHRGVRYRVAHEGFAGQFLWLEVPGGKVAWGSDEHTLAHPTARIDADYEEIQERIRRARAHRDYVAANYHSDRSRGHIL